MIDNIVRFRVFDYNLAGIALTEREQGIQDKYKDLHIIYRTLSKDEVKKLSGEELQQLGKIEYGQQDRLVEIIETIKDGNKWREKVCNRVAELCEQGISAGHIYCGDPIPRNEDGEVVVNL